MAMHRALTDFVIGPPSDENGNPTGGDVRITGGHHYDDRDKTYQPVIARFPEKFEAIK